MLNIFKSKIFINLSNQFILYGFSHIIPLILIPYLISTIGIEKYGLINFAIAFSFYFQVINEFGYDLSNVQFIVKNRNDRIKLSQYLSEVLFSKHIILLITGICYFVILFLMGELEDNLILYILVFVRLYGIIIAPFWLFRSLENIGYITKIIIPVKVIASLPIFIFVHSPSDYNYVMLFYALESLLSGILSLIISLKHYNLKLHYVKISEIKKSITDSFPFFISTFLTRVYTTSNVLILGLLFGNKITGIYSASEKLYSAYASFINPVFNQVLYPYFTRIRDLFKINKVVIYITIANAILLVIIYFISPLLINTFITEDSNLILKYFRYLLVVLLISIPNELIGYPYLGVLSSSKVVNRTTYIAGISYIVFIVILYLTNFITITSLILALGSACLISLIQRIFLIRKIYNKI